ncbi:MAG: SDR family oxidoreductase, partial [Pseudomonadota bacterium]
MGRLSNKTAVVTGAARGIGLAVCERFLEEDARVILTDIDPDAGAREATRLGCEVMQLDVRSETDWSALLAARPAFDILVNNAGVTGFEAGGADPHDPEHASLDAWRAVHATNLDGVFLGCRTAIAAMRAAGAGAIVNISSRSGMVGVPRAAAYASSKAAVRNHTKSVALYCAEEGLDIRCNSVHPAAVMTPMWEPMLPPGDGRDAAIADFVKDTPLRRFGEAREVAETVVFLASDEARYMTGAELTIDGGLLAG